MEKHVNAIAMANPGVPFWQAVLDALPGAVLLTDARGMVLGANRAVRQQLAHEPAGTPLLDLLEAEFGIATAALVPAAACLVLAAAQPALNVPPLRLAAADGLHWYALHVAALGPDEGAPLLATIDDVSQSVLLDMALQASRQQLRELVQHSETVKENERKRIARDIHDELGQNMLALRIDATMLQVRTARHPLLQARVTAAIAHIDLSIKSVRAIINSLRPPVLDLGLQAAIEWQAREFARRTRIDCQVAPAVGPEVALDETRATAMFRIVQEALSNVARHARASQVAIALQTDPKQLILTLSDNGVGIAPACRRKANAFGLLGVAERVDAMHGRLQVGASAGGGGTTVSIAIPMTAPA